MSSSSADQLWDRLPRPTRNQRYWFLLLGIVFVTLGGAFYLIDRTIQNVRKVTLPPLPVPTLKATTDQVVKQFSESKSRLKTLRDPKKVTVRQAAAQDLPKVETPTQGAIHQPSGTSNQRGETLQMPASLQRLEADPQRFYSSTWDEDLPQKKKGGWVCMGQTGQTTYLLHLDTPRTLRFGFYLSSYAPDRLLVNGVVPSGVQVTSDLVFTVNGNTNASVLLTLTNKDWQAWTVGQSVFKVGDNNITFSVPAHALNKNGVCIYPPIQITQVSEQGKP